MREGMHNSRVASGGTTAASDMGRGFAEERKGGGPVIVAVDPFRCRIWEYHDRMEEYLTEETCAREIESFKRYGQLVPAIGRPVRGSSEYDVEIVCGARRLYVARFLALKLRVELRPLSDRDALIAMDVENRHRKEMSAYERGRVYKRWLQAKIFASQDVLARTLNVSPSQVCRLIQLAELPSAIVSAFGSPLVIREGWGVELHRVWQNADMRPLIAQRARTMAARLGARKPEQVYRWLMAPAGKGTLVQGGCREEVVRDLAGRPLFRVKHNRYGTQFAVRISPSSAELLGKVRRALVEILQDEMA